MLSNLVREECELFMREHNASHHRCWHTHCYCADCKVRRTLTMLVRDCTQCDDELTSDNGVT